LTYVFEVRINCQCFKYDLKMPEKGEEQASHDSRGHASSPQSEADEDAAEILAGLTNPENDLGTSGNAAQVSNWR